jgi:sulfur-oxidizing protein SoxY
MRRVIALMPWLIGTLLPMTALPAEEAANTAIWAKVRASLFADRPIREPAEDIVRLRVPARAADAAVVPLAVSVGVSQSEERYVQALYIVIDNNPSPIAAVFRFTPDSGRADIETRVRIEDYTHVRAIVELNTGELFAATRYVKAAGGCSAPAAKTDADAKVGRMRLVLDEDVIAGEEAVARLSVMHPNHSGLAMDQFTRHYTPSWYVRTIAVSYAGKRIMTADVDFSISENPNLRFHFIAREPGVLKAEVVDTKDLVFEAVLDVQPGANAKASADGK